MTGRPRLGWQPVCFTQVIWRRRSRSGRSYIRPILQTPATDANSPSRITRWRFSRAMPESTTEQLQTTWKGPVAARRAGARVSRRRRKSNRLGRDPEQSWRCTQRPRTDGRCSGNVPPRRGAHEAAFAKTPNDVLCGRFLATSYRNVAHAQNELGRNQEAERWFQKAIDHCRQMTVTIPRCRHCVPLSTRRLTLSGNSSSSQDRKADSAEAFRIAAAAIAEMPRRTAADWYNLACVQARSAGAIGAGKPELSEQAKADRLRLADAAIEFSRSRAIDGDSEPPSRSGTTTIWKSSAAVPISRRCSFERKPPRKQPPLAARGDSGSTRGQSSRTTELPWRPGRNWSRKILDPLGTGPTWRPVGTPLARSLATSAGSSRPKRT